MDWTPELDNKLLRCRNGYWSYQDIAELHDWGATYSQVRERIFLLDSTIRRLRQQGYPAEAIALQTDLPLDTVNSCLFWASQYKADLPPPGYPQEGQEEEEEEETEWDGPLYRE